MTPDRSAEDRLGAQSCSVAARLRSDPLAGSAPPARGWLVFEHPGPWPQTAVEVFGDLGPEMARRCLAVGVRPMLVRRPGRAADPGSSQRSWWFIDSLARTSLAGSWSGEQDVPAVLDLVDVGRGDAIALMAPAEPMVLVCTHAKHDVCCAVRGRPIAAKLAERWPDLVWECSHLGGDRFAGNVAMLPDSTFYGRLAAAAAERVVADHLAGQTTLDHYRGSGMHQPPAQVAVAELLRRAGSRRFADVGVLGVESIGDGWWEVVLGGRGDLPAHTVLTVQRRWRPAERLTCTSDHDAVAAEFTVR